MSTAFKLATAVLVIGALPALAACGTSADTPDGKPSTAATPSASADPVAVARKQAEDAYRGMWAAYVKGLQQADPQQPDLARFASDNALALITKAIKQTADAGLRGRGDVALQPSVGGLGAGGNLTAATVSDCVDTSKTELYKADGSPYRDTPGGKRALTATLKSVDGSWKVTDFALREVGTCG